MSDVTQILERIESGDRQATEQLLPLVYDELRRLAARGMARESPDHTLQATALVHEAYMKLVDAEKVRRWDSRWHFFSAAAEAMRRILIAHARKRSSLKRGGDRERVDVDPGLLPADDRPERLLALDEAIDRLAVQDSDKAELVKLRYFAGLTIEDSAAALGISTATANRYWTYARAWLQRELSEPDDFVPA